ncbi:MAG: GntR family transcriptional regulator [Bacillota bacterium]
MSKYQKKWEQIANVLRTQIQTGTLKPGQEFPTNIDLMKTFDVHAGTIQQAVNALISEGLVITYGGSARRTVYNPPSRSTRCCGFLSDAGKSGRQEIIEIKFIEKEDLLPESARNHVETPALLYKTLQWKDNIPVAISSSFLPQILPLDFMKKELSTGSVELYELMKDNGFVPTTCRESLIAALPTVEEQEILQLPNSTMPVVKIKRLVFDARGNLLEYCLLIDRSDCYEFQYEFPMKS